MPATHARTSPSRHFPIGFPTLVLGPLTTFKKTLGELKPCSWVKLSFPGMADRVNVTGSTVMTGFQQSVRGCVQISLKNIRYGMSVDYNCFCLSSDCMIFLDLTFDSACGSLRYPRIKLVMMVCSGSRLELGGTTKTLITTPHVLSILHTTTRDHTGTGRAMLNSVGLHPAHERYSFKNQPNPPYS